MKSVLNQALSELKGVMADVLAPWQSLTTASPVKVSDDIAQRISIQQLRKLVCQPPSAVLEPVLGSAIWLAALWWIAPGSMAAVYTLLVAGSLGASYLALRQCARHDPSDEELWVRGAQRGRLAVFSGVLWGSVGFCFPHLVQPFGSFVAIGQLMVIAGALSISVTYRPAISWLAVPCAGLTCASLIIHGAGLNIAVGVGFVVVVVVMMRMARVQNTLITQSMQAAEERVAILAELDKQRIAAQEATQAKTRFLAGVSHDLRQPMHSIALLAETFRQQDDPKGMVSRQISASVHAMDDMLSALLEVSKLDVGALPLDVGPVAVDAMLQRLQMQFSAQAHSKGIDLTVLPCGLRVLTDAYQLQRMLANLTSNAVRYTATGRIVIRGRSRGSTLWLQVWDSGLGIALGHRQRIFEEFFQVARTSHRTVEGMGLGLSLVRRAAERLGHQVTLRSRFGKGSMFAIGVPLVQSQVDAADACSGEVSLKEMLGARLVLLIEDDLAVRQGMLMLLRSFNCHVMEADSSQAALSLVNTTLRTPDLIITDYQLGESDTGLDAIRKVREVVDGNVPAVLVTAERNPPRDGAALLGVPVLAKPLKPRDLALALSHVLVDLVENPHKG
jgi:signal transduction histidine kinase/CheY-like chemotaxis protein